MVLAVPAERCFFVLAAAVFILAAMVFIPAFVLAIFLALSLAVSRFFAFPAGQAESRRRCLFPHILQVGKVPAVLIFLRGGCEGIFAMGVARGGLSIVLYFL